MKAGVIGEVKGDTDELTSYETESSVEVEGIDSLKRCVEVVDEINLADGRTAKIGRAAMEDVVESEEIQIEGGNIRQYESPEKGTRYTEFLFVPSSFVAVSGGAGTFAFTMIASRTNASVANIEFDLDEFVDDKAGVNPWKVGFYGNVSNAENGVLHGDQLLDDSEFGGLLSMSDKNQIGLEYQFGDFDVKMFASANGYVEVYQPSNIKTNDYIKFIEEEMLPYAREV